MKNLKVSKYSLLLSSVLFLAVFVPSVLAVGKPDTIPGRLSSAGGIPTGLPSQAQSHLTDARLKACLARENSINTRSTHLTQLATTMQEKFDAIAGRVEDYYTTKVLPSGKTVTNYSALVTNIATKKVLVQTALTKAQNDLAGFSCDGIDPKAQMTQYRKDMQLVIQALKDYRTSIKNLIVAVRSVTGTTEKASPSPTP